MLNYLLVAFVKELFVHALIDRVGLNVMTAYSFPPVARKEHTEHMQEY